MLRHLPPETRAAGSAAGFLHASRVLRFLALSAASAPYLRGAAVIGKKINRKTRQTREGRWNRRCALLPARAAADDEGGGQRRRFFACSACFAVALPRRGLGTHAYAASGDREGDLTAKHANHAKGAAIADAPCCPRVRSLMMRAAGSAAGFLRVLRALRLHYLDADSAPMPTALPGIGKEI